MSKLLPEGAIPTNFREVGKIDDAWWQSYCDSLKQFDADEYRRDSDRRKRVFDE